MTHRKHIYLASTLALLSLSAFTFANTNQAQADTTNSQTITAADSTSSTTNTNNNNNSVNAEQSSTTNADTTTTTTTTATTDNATTTTAANQQTTAASADKTQTTGNTNNTDNTDNTSTTSPLASTGAKAQVAASYTVSKAAAQTAYDGTPIINIGDSQYPRVDAVDISAYQAALTAANFVTLKNRGVKTIIVKLTEGTSYTNQYAWQQISNARSAGLNIQVYHYAHFGSYSAAVSEANHLADVMSSLGLSSSTRIYADMEDSTTKYSSVANDLRGFWAQLNNRGYTNHAVYASTSYDATYNVSSTVGKNKTWIAQYVYSPSASNLLNRSYGAWQFNAHGKIPGYSGELDISIDYQSLFGDTGQWTKSNGSWYYSQNGQNVTGWQSINGNWYHFDSNGAAQTGWQSINGNWYYFDTTNAWALKGWQYINSHWYYFDPTNAWADRGWFKSGAGRWYYFDWTNAWALTGWQGINGHWYYFDNTNAWALTGWQYMDNSWLYFDPTNAWQDKGWAKIDGHWFYFDDKGHMLTGLQTINGKIYDLQTEHDGNFGAMKTGWQKINGSWYYFNGGGDAATGWFKSGAGNWYYFDNNGQALTGWRNINNRWYYFDPNNAWALRGWQYMDNNWLYFDPTNAWQYKGWTKVGSQWFYFDNNGHMLNGLQTINGKLYYLNSNHDGSFGAMKTGWQKIDGSWYYFDGNGQAMTGSVYINGKLYEFDSTSGKLK
ncbi:GH25 family lysozyme [Limosilactobacillus kribbianus]|uniref:GH25 family lysozyme n=1 Tax=Limosilactobacillus kribbianus TaxID=2982695 RepID=UPI002264F13F